MILYFSKMSPFARKVLIVAMETGIYDQIKVQTVEVSPIKTQNDYFDKNPLGKLPALELDDKSVIVDSAVICEYLDSIGRKNLYPQELVARTQVLSDQAIISGATDSAVLLRYETFLRPEQYRWQEWVDGQWKKIWSTLDLFERRKSDGHLSIDVIALGCLLGYLDLRFSECGWRAKYPRLSDLYLSLMERPSFSSTAAG